MNPAPSSKTTGTTTVGCDAASTGVEIRAMRAMQSFLVMNLYRAMLRTLGEAGHSPGEVTKPIEVRDHHGFTKVVTDRESFGTSYYGSRNVEGRRRLILPGHHELLGHLDYFGERVDLGFQASDHLGGDASLSVRELVAILGRGGDFGHQDPEVALDADEEFVESRIGFAERPSPTEGRLRFVDRAVDVDLLRALARSASEIQTGGAVIAVTRVDLHVVSVVIYWSTG